MSRRKHWKAPLIAAAIAAAIAGGHASRLGESVESHAAQRLAFNVRAALGRGPGLDPRIKVFAFDDTTVAALHDLDLPLPAWEKVLAALARQVPRGIFIDKLFD